MNKKAAYPSSKRQTIVAVGLAMSVVALVGCQSAPQVSPAGSVSLEDAVATDPTAKVYQSIYYHAQGFPGDIDLGFMTAVDKAVGELEDSPTNRWFRARAAVRVAQHSTFNNRVLSGVKPDRHRRAIKKLLDFPGANAREFVATIFNALHPVRSDGGNGGAGSEGTGSATPFTASSMQAAIGAAGQSYVNALVASGTGTCGAIEYGPLVTLNNSTKIVTGHSWHISPLPFTQVRTALAPQNWAQCSPGLFANSFIADKDLAGYAQYDPVACVASDLSASVPLAGSSYQDFLIETFLLPLNSGYMSNVLLIHTEAPPTSYQIQYALFDSLCSAIGSSQNPGGFVEVNWGGVEVATRPDGSTDVTVEKRIRLGAMGNIPPNQIQTYTIVALQFMHDAIVATASCGCAS